MISSGDEVIVVSNKMSGTISVAVEGEQNGQVIYILPYSSTMNDLMARFQPNERSNIEAMQLFR